LTGVTRGGRRVRSGRSRRFRISTDVRHVTDRQKLVKKV